MRLSEHFDSSEFTCRCGCRDWQVHHVLVEALETLRWRLGGKPLIVNSGFRCKVHNTRIGGAPSSQHLIGRAADVRSQQTEPAEIFEAALQIPAFAGIGCYDTFVHLDVRHAPRVVFDKRTRRSNG